MKTSITRLLSVATALTALFVSGSLAARDFDRGATPWVAGVSGGWQSRATASDEKGVTTFDDGYGLNAQLGHRFDAFRVEGEFSYFRNQNKTTDPNGPFIGKEPSSGFVDIRGLFVNAYYDLDIEDSPLSPYIGAGVGTVQAKIHGLTTPSLSALPPAFGGPVIVYGDSDWEAAFQLRLGVTYAIASQIDLSLGYRYVKSRDLRFDLNDGSMIHPNGIELHNAELGLHFRF